MCIKFSFQKGVRSLTYNQGYESDYFRRGKQSINTIGSRMLTAFSPKIIHKD